MLPVSTYNFQCYGNFVSTPSLVIYFRFMLGISQSDIILRKHCSEVETEALPTNDGCYVRMLVCSQYIYVHLKLASFLIFSSFNLPFTSINDAGLRNNHRRFTQLDLKQKHVDIR